MSGSEVPDWSDWATELFTSVAAKRNIELECSFGTLIDERGESVGAIAFLRQGTGPAKVKVNYTDLASWAYAFCRIFLDDLLHSPHEQDRRVAANMLKTAERDLEFRHWIQTIVTKAHQAGQLRSKLTVDDFLNDQPHLFMSSKTTGSETGAQEEFLAQQTGQYFKQHAGEDVNSFKANYKQLLSAAKLRYGNATPEDAYRLLHNRLVKDAPFKETYRNRRDGSVLIRDQKEVPALQPRSPTMSIFTNMFGGLSPKPRIFSAPEWKLLVPQLNQELRTVRVSWYEQCVAELSKVRPGVIRNFTLEREGEFLTDIYQILLAWYFVTANGYIAANEIPVFALEMQGHLVTVCGAQNVLDASKRYYCDGREKIADYMTFSRDMALFMVGTTNDYDALVICRSIAWFTKATYMMVAKTFADQSSINRLFDDVDAMAQQKDVDYVDPSKYQMWKR